MQRGRVEAAVPWIDLGLVLLPFVVAILGLIAMRGSFDAISDQASEEMLTLLTSVITLSSSGRTRGTKLESPLDRTFYVAALPYRLAGSSLDRAVDRRRSH